MNQTMSCGRTLAIEFRYASATQACCCGWTGCTGCTGCTFATLGNTQDLLSHNHTPLFRSPLFLRCPRKCLTMIPEGHSTWSKSDQERYKQQQTKSLSSNINNQFRVGWGQGRTLDIAGTKLDWYSTCRDHNATCTRQIKFDDVYE